jgi:isochorismate synthase
MLQSDTKTYTTSNFKEKGFVFSPFDTILPTYLIPKNASKQLYLEAAPLYSKQFRLNSIKSDSTAHKKLIQQAIKNIESTKLEKVVLARTSSFEFQDCDEIDLFLSIANAYPEAYVYCWFHPKTGFWLGASPETLLKITGQNVKTMALAGTQNYVDTLQVKWDAKNYEEQKFVTEFLKNKLVSHLTDLEVSVPKTIKAGKLLHLQTTLTGHLKSTSDALKQLIFSIHPTPAVCGTPKSLAMSFIKNHESINRMYYSGFLGHINMSIENQIPETNLVVNLRCMHLNGKSATLFAGGGITSKSDATTEWNETEAKLNTIMSALES